ncbi:MAG: TOMM precursor leader peptide-binding protein, partial [Bacillota bacterium]
GDQIQVRSAHKAVLMSGSSVGAVSRMLDLLDGTRDVPQILECFPEIPGDQVLRTLKTLYDKGLIEDGAGEGDPAGDSCAGNEAQATFFSMVFRDGRLAQDLLGKARVVVFGLGRVGSHVVSSLARSGVGQITGIDDGPVDGSLVTCGGLYLPGDAGRARAEAAGDRVRDLGGHTRFEAAGVRVTGESDVAPVIRGADLALVCQDSPTVNIYRAVNAAALRERVRWLRVSLEGFEAQLGPCVLPRDTACYTCYEFRSRGNWPHYDESLAFEEYLAGSSSAGEIDVDYGCPAPAPAFLGNLAALEALKLLTGFSYPTTCGKMWTFNMNSFEARHHVVLKLPRCPSCGLTVANPGQAQWAL